MSELTRIEINVDNENQYLHPQEIYQIINVKGVLLHETCDLPAKAQFLNKVHFTGRFGNTKILFFSDKN